MRETLRLIDKERGLERETDGLKKRLREREEEREREGGRERGRGREREREGETETQWIREKRINHLLTECSVQLL